MKKTSFLCSCSHKPLLCLNLLRIWVRIYRGIRLERGKKVRVQIGLKGVWTGCPHAYGAHPCKCCMFGAHKSFLHARRSRAGNWIHLHIRLFSCESSWCVCTCMRALVVRECSSLVRSARFSTWAKILHVWIPFFAHVQAHTCTRWVSTPIYFGLFLKAEFLGRASFLLWDPITSSFPVFVYFSSS